MPIVTLSGHRWTPASQRHTWSRDATCDKDHGKVLAPETCRETHLESTCIDIEYHCFRIRHKRQPCTSTSTVSPEPPATISGYLQDIHRTNNSGCLNAKNMETQ
ncbi:hypothetical protein BaRGS_00035093 [Batillaria attramentaria]|uniref:Uncharacterized protein n=1 Tax=Batillaria attramentaria TaxID=370345 RepID=A0ABD0JFL3_9CAEN